MATRRPSASAVVVGVVAICLTWLAVPRAQIGIPLAPTNLTSAVTGTAVALSWSAPTSGAAVLSYILEAGSGPGLSNLANADTGSSSTIFSAPGVPPGLYYVRVRARGVGGVGPASNEATVVVGGACTPSAPTSFTATASGSTVTLNWTAPTACAPASYLVEAGSSSGLANIASVPTGGTTFTASGVPPGTYFLRVRAVLVDGSVGPPSNEVQVVVTGSGCVNAPLPPVGFTANVSGNTVVFAWTATPSATTYILEAGTSPGVISFSFDLGSAATTFTVAAPNGTYYVRLRAANACGLGQPSAGISVSVGGSSGSLLAGAVFFTGPYPAITNVRWSDRTGRVGRVPAFSGHVQVFFQAGTAESTAVDAIQGNSGIVIERIPVLAYYLARVTPGTERAFITAMLQRSIVSSAVPHMAGLKARAGVAVAGRLSPAAASIPGVTLFETCGDSHYFAVRDALTNNGGSYRHCRDIAPNGSETYSNALVAAFAREAEENAGTPVLINLSTYGTAYDDYGDYINGDNYFSYGDEIRSDLQSAWKTFMQVTLESIAALPPDKRDNLVVAIAAGNNNTPVAALLQELRQDPRLAHVLASNLVVVSTHRTLANFAPGDLDFLYVENDEAASGSSLAAPAALAIIQRVMELTGATAKEALLAAKQAAAANNNYALVQQEAVAAATALLDALRFDSIGAASVTAISLTGVGSTTTAQITPKISAVSVRFSVSGTDGYFDTGTLRTNTEGVVSFNIPAGASGVTDTIAVTAVVSGRIARTQFTW